jgi:hypothetical protein
MKSGRDAGIGFALGVSAQCNGSSGPGTTGLPIPKIGEGAGAYADVGAGYVATAATTSICQ